MSSIQSSSSQFMRYLESVGGSEADVTGPNYVVSDTDTVESVVSRLRMEQYASGGRRRDPSILHASAQVLISRRDERSTGHGHDVSREGAYQLDIHHGGVEPTRESIPRSDLNEAKAWAMSRLDAEGADFGAIYFPSGGKGGPGTGALTFRFDRAVGWYH
jgi:hypothetical protein